MKVRIVVVGGIKGSLGDVVGDYQNRAKRYWRLNVDEVAAGARSKKASAADVRAAEAPRILARVPERGTVFLMSREGRGMSSSALASLLEKHMVGSAPELCFIVGGAFGVGEGVRRRANHVFSLSEGTLPHEIARLVLVEQLYRAGTILRNQPYHKGDSK